MSKRKRKCDFNERLNIITRDNYFVMLLNLAISCIEWKGLPDTVDPRYLEYTLLTEGSAVFFREPDVGDLALNVNAVAPYTVYGIPVRREAHSDYNNFHRELNPDNSVMIYNTYMRDAWAEQLDMYAMRLANVMRTIDVNIMGQKTPKIITCSENQRTTLEVLFRQYRENHPFIFGDSRLDLNQIVVLDTSSPYVADKLQTVKRQLMNEALTFIGIENNSNEKAERLVQSESLTNSGQVEAMRFVRLAPRQQACEEINRKFGLNVSVAFKSPLAKDLANEEGEDDGQVHDRATDGMRAVRRP